MGVEGRPGLLAAAILAAVLAGGCGTDTGSAPSPAPSRSERTTTSPSPSPAPQSGEALDDPLGGRPALWPFRTRAGAHRWQTQGAGQAPWHLDAEATALMFTTRYLGYPEIDRVIESEIGATEALVTVGYRGELPEPAPAAVLRLVRFGDGTRAPWQVVGTVDDTITITSPEPNARVGSPIEVTGRVTGVDESIQVRVHDPGRPGPVGEACCLPGGGQNTPWSTTVPVREASDATLTIVAATGGHAASVERFAVTGARLIR